MSKKKRLSKKRNLRQKRLVEIAKIKEQLWSNRTNQVNICYDTFVYQRDNIRDFLTENHIIYTDNFIRDYSPPSRAFFFQSKDDAIEFRLRFAG